MTFLVILIERSERSEHTVVLSLTFLSILYTYIYSVTKILRKIRATTFTENYGKLCVGGRAPGIELTQPCTHSLPARIQWLS